MFLYIAIAVAASSLYMEMDISKMYVHGKSFCHAETEKRARKRP